MPSLLPLAASLEADTGAMTRFQSVIVVSRRRKFSVIDFCLTGAVVRLFFALLVVAEEVVVMVGALVYTSISIFKYGKREEVTYWLHDQRASHPEGNAQKPFLSLCGDIGSSTWL